MRSVINIVRKHLHVSFAVLGGFLIGAALFFNPVPAYASSNKGDCKDIAIPVALAPGQPKNKTIHGELCNPWSSAPDSVDVLVPGGTYDGLYWDFPLNNYEYSYVDRTLRAGRATFNIDRMGTGESSKPLSTSVTFDADVYTVHQAIQWLRNERGYSDVTSIGHSVGSFVVTQEAALYNDVDRLVPTGFLHSPSFNMITTLGTGLVPAMLDPQFAGSNLDPGYVTLAAGQRKKAFYSSTADPAVIAYDEAHKDVISLLDLKGAAVQLLVPAPLNNSQKITIPVLAIVGDQDILCGPPVVGANCSSSETVGAYEQKYFQSAESFTAHVVPNTGHNLPLHPSADESFTVIDQWIKTH